MRTCTRSRGAALLITLAFVVMITILIVGLTISMRTDRPAADAYLEKTRATQFAQSGVEEVLATLQKYSSATSGNADSNWASQPGQLMVNDAGDNRLVTAVPLHSGASGSASDTESVDLNVVTYRDPGSHLITNLSDASGSGAVANMRLAWKYVRCDPGQPPFDSPGTPLDTTSAAARSNPIVGRYAYWTDDESAKVNYNIAWGRGTGDAVQDALPPGEISRVDLATALDPASPGAPAAAAAIHHGITKTDASTGTTGLKFYNTPEDARRVGETNAEAADLLVKNKFNVTHYNHDPNTTFFNEERIVLTTRPERAGWTFDEAKGKWVGINGLPSQGVDGWTVSSSGKVVGGGRPLFLDIAAVDPSDSTGKTLFTNLWTPLQVVEQGGKVLAEATVDTAKLSRVIKVLNSYISRTDWPMARGSSFQAKYYTGKTDRITQLSLNIIDYVRSRESNGHPGGLRPGLNETGVIIPIRGKGTTNFIIDTVAQDATSFLGISRCPKITELGMAVSPAPVSTGPGFYRYAVTYKVELYLPKNFGFESLDLTQFGVGCQGINPRNSAPNGGAAITPITAANCTNTILRAGEYQTVTVPNARIEFASPRLPTGEFGVRAFLSLNIPGSTPRLELCPLSGFVVDAIPLPFEATGDLNNIVSKEVDDPRVNSHKDDWKPPVGVKNTFGAQNTVSTLGKAAAGVTPEQDTDTAGVISDLGMYMPPPAGKQITLPSGALDDNRLGQVISAGELGFIHTGMESAKGAGIPWRTLRLQPNRDSVSVVPDWALIDLFTAPTALANDENRYVFAPHETAFGGRVNLNAGSVPFQMDRVLPLAAVLKGCTYDATDLSRKLDATRARAIAGRILTMTDGDPANDTDSLATNGKRYGAGGLFDSPGELVEIKGVSDEGEKSEELARQVMNLVTTRGSVFSVYTVGQSLKQAPNGALIVTGEQRIQAMIERYLVYDAASNSNSARFAAVYYRTLSP